ncbi:MAG TPA: hypothetical protein VNQ90_00690, partial [Chthoniobacteraceae bacterium]|nr:hypothetical protein [Chthoniobacteraceae bacterium]
MSKPLRWLSGEVKTPPMSMEARREVGYLLRMLQEGEKLSLPHSRPMPSVGARCHELRGCEKSPSKAMEHLFLPLTAFLLPSVFPEYRRSAEFRYRLKIGAPRPLKSFFH